MKIIDLLNKIANGEVPKKIIFENQVLKYDKDGQDYIVFEDGYLFCRLFSRNNNSFLNDEVEILDDEEKGLPEKLNYPHIEIESSADDEIRDYLYKVKDKFDEIIDYLEKQRKGE